VTHLGSIVRCGAHYCREYKTLRSMQRSRMPCASYELNMSRPSWKNSGVEGSSNVHGGNARNVPAILIHDVKLQTRRSKTFVGLVVTISGESDKATG